MCSWITRQPQKTFSQSLVHRHAVPRMLHTVLREDETCSCGLTTANRIVKGINKKGEKGPLELHLLDPSHGSEQPIPLTEAQSSVDSPPS